MVIILFWLDVETDIIHGTLMLIKQISSGHKLFEIKQSETWIR